MNRVYAINQEQIKATELTDSDLDKVAGGIVVAPLGATPVTTSGRSLTVSEAQERVIGVGGGTGGGGTGAGGTGGGRP